MAWMEVNKVEQRKLFILRLLNGERMSDLCREYDISRPTGYKFFERYQQQGLSGLSDLSRRPLHSPARTDEVLEQYILKIKERHSSWGPKKIKTVAEQEHPGLAFPATSTIGAILDKHGLVQKRKRRIKRSYHPSLLTDSQACNDVWCIDYKGQFLTGDRRYCYPLTISDHYSRFFIACEALESTRLEEAFPIFEHCFSEYGLPKIIRSDNGTPFATVNGLFGLTRLSAWFLKLGIHIERIEPGHPEQNGRHERLHRTLKQETTRPAAANILKQQERFDRFRHIYNQKRPHEALNQQTPLSIFKKSITSYQPQTELAYPLHDFSRKVRQCGTIKLLNRSILLSTALAGELVGLRDLDASWLVSYAEYDLGYIAKDSFRFESLEYLEA
jgi:transposase InsO family protein